MDSPSPRSVNLLALAFAFEGGMAVLALALGWLLDRPPAAYLHWNLAGVGWGCLGSLPMLVLLLFITHVPLGPFVRLNQIVSDVILPLFESCTWLDLATISLLAGVGEELLFRGVLQVMLGVWISPAAGLVLASILFGLAHAITPTYAVMATIFGLYLGGLWLLTDNLLVAIVAHGVYDFVALVYLDWRHTANGRTAA